MCNTCGEQSQPPRREGHGESSVRLTYGNRCWAEHGVSEKGVRRPSVNVICKDEHMGRPIRSKLKWPAMNIEQLSIRFLAKVGGESSTSALQSAAAVVKEASSPNRCPLHSLFGESEG